MWFMTGWARPVALFDSRINREAMEFECLTAGRGGTCSIEEIVGKHNVWEIGSLCPRKGVYNGGSECRETFMYDSIDLEMGIYGGGNIATFHKRRCYCACSLGLVGVDVKRWFRGFRVFGKCSYSVHFKSTYTSK